MKREEKNGGGNTPRSETAIIMPLSARQRENVQRPPAGSSAALNPLLRCHENGVADLPQQARAVVVVFPAPRAR